VVVAIIELHRTCWCFDYTQGLSPYPVYNKCSDHYSYQIKSQLII